MPRRVLLLATGGTLASRPGPDGAVTAVLKGADLLAQIGRERDTDPDEPIDVVDIAHGASWNFEPSFLAELATTARDALVEGRADGVVVTHGTDTVEESLWLTELLAGDATDRGPIVFTCAMRNDAERSPDGPRNLEHAIAVARAEGARGRGALLCVNDELHAARWVTKTDTSSITTFRSPATGPVGHMVRGVPWFRLPSPPRPVPAPAGIDPAVALIHSYQGVDGDQVGWHLDRGAHGLVVEGSGAGNVHHTLVPGIEQAIATSIPVVVTSRCLTGSVSPTYGGPGGGASLARAGVISGGDLGSVKARLALMVALALDPSPDAVRAWFARL